MGYLLSIAVATKNRYEYLKSLIDLVSETKNDDVELVIHDNSDNNKEIIEYLESVNVKNIKYYYSTEIMSQTENCNKAIYYCTGKYNCLLGDDDSFSYEIVSFLRSLDDEIEFVNFNCAKFTWAGIKGKIHKLPDLIIRKNNGKLSPIKGVKEFIRSAKKGFCDVTRMPMLYHGIAKREALEKIYSKTGSFFPGPSPDISNAVSQALLDLKSLYCKTPYIIDGVCPKSAAGLGASHMHKGKISEIKQLPLDCEKNWDKRVPKIWTGETIYLESVLKSLDKIQKIDMEKYINYSYFYSYFSVFHKDYKREMKESIRFCKTNIILIELYKIIIFLRRCKRFIANIFRFKFKIHTKTKYYSCKSSKEASKIVSNYIRNNYYEKNN